MNIDLTEDGYSVNFSEDSIQVNFSEDVLNVKVVEMMTITNPGGLIGDMYKADYDPNAVEGDAFDMDNMVESNAAKILTVTERNKIAASVTQGSLDTIESESKDRDTTLQNNLDSVESASQSADTTLQNNINTVESESVDRDTTLANTINAVSQASTDADTVLQENIDTNRTESNDADTAIAESVVTANQRITSIVETYDPDTIEGDVFDMDNMKEGTGKILTQEERDKISLVHEWSIEHPTSDVNPAIPYTIYKVNATTAPVTIYLPDPIVDCTDEFDVELDIDTHKVTITTVSGVVGAIEGEDSISIPGVGGKLRLKCHGVEGYDVIFDTRGMGSIVDIDSHRDFSTDGFEHNTTYRISPAIVGDNVLITFPPPKSFDDKKFIESSFALTGDGSFTIIRSDGGFIGGQIQQTVSTLNASINIVEGDGEYSLSQDSRPKAAESIVEIPLYRLDEDSDIPGYFALAGSKDDPRYGAEIVKLSGAVTDATVGNPANYASYITDAGNDIGYFPATRATFYVTTKKIALGSNPSQDRNVLAYYELYKRTELGVETLVVKTSEFVVTSDVYSQFQISVQTPEMDFEPGERFLVKVFLEKSATGGINPELSTLIEGDNGAYMAFSQPTSALRHDQLNGRVDANQHPSTAISFDNAGTPFTSEAAQDAIEEASGFVVSGSRQFGDIAGGNVTEFETDGTVVMKGDATVWEDIQGSLIGRRLYSNQGTVDYDFYENTVLFSQNGDITDRDDFVAWNYQYPHSAKADGEFRLHMHYERVDTTVYEFTLWYRVQNTGGIKNTAWIPVVVSTADRDVFPYVSGTLNQIVKIVEIDMTGFTISSQMQFRFTRTDSNGGTVAATFIDGHFERDTLGSNEEFVK